MELSTQRMDLETYQNLGQVRLLRDKSVIESDEKLPRCQNYQTGLYSGYDFYIK